MGYIYKYIREKLCPLICCGLKVYVFCKCSKISWILQPVQGELLPARKHLIVTTLLLWPATFLENTIVFLSQEKESEVCWSLQEITSQSWSWGMFADKLPIKISKLRKYWTSFIFLGSCHVEIYCTFAESIYILSVEIIQTSNPIGEDQIYST